MSATEAAPTIPARRSLRVARFVATIAGILTLLFGLPWWTIVVASAHWPAPVLAVGTAGFAAALVAFPVLMYVGHGRRHWDWAARAGDTILGVIWVLFAWSVLGNVLRLLLMAVGVADPLRSRVVAVGGCRGVRCR